MDNEGGGGGRGRGRVSNVRMEVKSRIIKKREQNPKTTSDGGVRSSSTDLAGTRRSRELSPVDRMIFATANIKISRKVNGKGEGGGGRRRGREGDRDPIQRICLCRV